MNTSSIGIRGRTIGAKWPEFPRMPEAMRASADNRRWDDEIQETWRDFRAQLDRVTVAGRDTTIINGGSTRIFNNGLASNGSGTGGASRPGGSGKGGGIPKVGPKESGDLPPGIFRSKEGGRYLVRLNGGRVFYQDVPPSEGKEGDLWYDTDDLFKLYLFIDGKWEPVFEDVPTIESKIARAARVARVAGFDDLDARTLLDIVNRQADLLLAEAEDRRAAIVQVQQTTATETTALTRRITVLNSEVRDPYSGLGTAHARITKEEDLRVTADEALASEINTLEVSLGAASAAIIAEQNARIAADGTITAALNTEVSARQSGDATLTASINTEQVARIAADQSLEAGLNTEVSARQSGDTALAASITTEQTARINADTSLEAGLNTEVSARQSGDNTLSAAITTEQTARISADNSITASLSAEVTARSDADDELEASITTEATARVTSDNSLAAEYVLSVVTGGASTRRVTGFRVTNLGGAGGGTEFVVQTDKFVIVDTSGDIPTVPFKVSGGQVYIDKAVITEVTAGAILAGTITVALTLTAASIVGGDITIGSGISKTTIDSSGAQFGDGLNLKVMGSGSFEGMFLRSGATIKSFWAYSSSVGSITLDLGGDPFSRIQNVNEVAAQLLRAFSTGDPRNADAPISTNGGAWIEKTLDVRGRGYFNSQLDVASHVNVVGNLNIGGAVGDARGIKFNSGATNAFALVWDGANVKVIVDGTLQGTIPNP
jgi:hypothetical protein